jgi:serine/threonine protein kinase
VSRIVGPYAIQGLLGSGGIGQVYAAIDQDLGRQVALKALRPEFSEDPDLLERFRNEAANLARLNHPNITTLYSLYRDTSSLRQSVFMVMEMVKGETLEAILARAGRLNTRGCLAVTAQAVAGLSYAHSVGIIHRDIKPSNLMLNDAGLLKITDFGIARVQGSERLTRHGAVVGTLNYIAPEQIKGHECDERSDLYSLACVLYELLSGRKPFVGLTEYELIRAQLEVEPEPLSASIPDLEPSIDHAVMRALAKNPEDRFSSVGEFAEALGTASIHDAAVAIVREQVLADIPLLASAPQDEGLFRDSYDDSPDLTQAASGQTAAQLPDAQTSTRPGKRGRVAALAIAAVVVAAGGAYLTYTDTGSDAVGVHATLEQPARPVATRAGPSAPSNKLAATQSDSPEPPGKSAPTRPTPSASSGARVATQPDLSGAGNLAAAQPEPSSSPGNSGVAQPEPSAPPVNPAAPEADPPQPPGNPAVGQAGSSAPMDNPAVAQTDSAGPRATGSNGGQPPAASTSAPPQTVAPSSNEGMQAATPQAPAPEGPPATGATTPKTLAGQVSSYSDDGWPVVEGVTVRLNGVGPLAPGEAKPVSDWIATHGNYLACTPSQPEGYRCLTRQNFDLAQAILLNGAARTSTDAAPAYREAEAHARTAKRGVWR